MDVVGFVVGFFVVGLDVVGFVVSVDVIGFVVGFFVVGLDVVGFVVGVDVVDVVDLHCLLRPLVWQVKPTGKKVSGYTKEESLNHNIAQRKQHDLLQQGGVKTPQVCPLLRQAGI